jgi:hypothetical protein
VEEVNLAVEKEGFFVVRPDEYAGRIKVSAPVEGLGHHFYYVRNDLTIMSFLYNRYHTLAINCEAIIEEGLVARCRRLLELGLETWRTEFYPGYPTNQIGCWGLMSVSAWGDVAEKRRRSRVELWDKANQLLFGYIYQPPVTDKLIGVCATTIEGAKRWLADESLEVFVRNLADHPRINQKYIADFVAGTVMDRVPAFNKAHYTQGYDPENTSNDSLRHGLSLRLFIPFNDAQIVEARIDGYPVQKSRTDGYQIRQNPGTVMQFNIPPGKVSDFHVASVEYDTPTNRKQGFHSEDWELPVK